MAQQEWRVEISPLCFLVPRPSTKTFHYPIQAGTEGKPVQVERVGGWVWRSKQCIPCTHTIRSEVSGEYGYEMEVGSCSSK
jgi:hypothetical protein